MGFRKYSESSLPIKKTLHISGLSVMVKVLRSLGTPDIPIRRMQFKSMRPLDSTETLFSYLNFYYNLKRGVQKYTSRFEFKILTTIRKIKILYTYYRIKMKNLNLHMECSLPMFTKTWAGRSVYNQISDCKLEVGTQEV